MASYVYIDVSHKQEFIFKHNKLKENLYNSFVIKAITENTVDIGEGPIISLKKYLEDEHHGCYEVVYSGGGNSIVRFSTKAEAIKFVRKYSGEVYRYYPDLELYISIVDDSQINSKSIEAKEKEIRDRLREEANKLKDKRRIKFKRWSYGVEEIDAAGQPVLCDSFERKHELSKKFLYQRLEEKADKAGFQVTEQLEDYKKDGDSKSYIGIISIDGNKMGDMVRRISTFQDLGKFSSLIEQLYESAVVNALIEYKHLEGLVTPIIMSGDDICLIVRAEHAIELAAAIVNHIQSLSRNENYRPFFRKVMDEGQRELTACAGVAIARYNYPFFEAVKTAELLCKQAKEAIHRVQGNANASFIHWDIVQGQVVNSYHYEDYVKHGRDIERFHIKPLRIDQTQPVENGIFSYDIFVNVIKNIQEAQEKQEISNSLMEGIKKVLYSGWESYKLFVDMDQTQDCCNLMQIMREQFKCDNDYGVVSEQQGQSIVYTYLLNDVIDALPYIHSKREAANSCG